MLRAGLVELDLARRRACAGAATVDLTDREFRLLHYLARHAGDIVSREQLLAEVWGYHFDPRSNVVDVCVRRLRKKLGPSRRSRRSDMWDTALQWPNRSLIDVVWVVFAIANFGAMVLWERGRRSRSTSSGSA